MHRRLEDLFARFLEQGKHERAMEILARYRLDGGSREGWLAMIGAAYAAEGLVGEIAAMYPGGDVPPGERDTVVWTLNRTAAWVHAVGTGDPSPAYAWSLRLRPDQPDVVWLLDRASRGAGE